VGSQQSSQEFAVLLRSLEERHLADLRFSEVSRALRALSSAYVERRETALAGRKTLDGAGKRAAFALYYGPIHFLLVQHIVRELGASPGDGTVVDLGCGTGVAGAAVALAADLPRRPHVLGVDTHPWALEEARFTYRALGIRADIKRGHAGRLRFPADTSFIVAAFVVNELDQADRAALLHQLERTTARVLIIEPISQRVSPWWPEWERALAGRSVRSDQWKVRFEAPPIIKRLAADSGLRPESLTARSLFA
jgi:predicted RNA methylase